MTRNHRLVLNEAQQAMLPLITEMLSMVSADCSWLVPVYDEYGQVTDFVIAAASHRSTDIAGRGPEERVGAQILQDRPGFKGSELWHAYNEVLETGAAWQRNGLVYEEESGGVPRTSVFDITANRLHGGVFVCWQRVDEHRRRLDHTELIGNLGWAEHDVTRSTSVWSQGLFRVFDRDPALGPMSVAEQENLILPEDKAMVASAWQSLADTGRVNLTFRIRLGGGIRHLRVLAELVHDAFARPLKIYAVVQDVTALFESSSALATAAAELRRKDVSLLAEQRIAAQLQQIILPVLEEPIDLADLRVMVQYRPAEQASRVGGDWYLATTSVQGAPILAIGDVVGHGIAAANAMAQLRYALSAWLTVGIEDPCELIGHLNRHCLRIGTTGTALISRFDTATATLTWAQAGHPAPLHARDGTVKELRGPRGLMLGVSESASFTSAGIVLRSGDLTLLYTDGLVEHRPGDPERRFAEVKSLLAGISAEWPDQPLAHLQGLLSDANAFDDTCLLAFRLRQ